MQKLFFKHLEQLVQKTEPAEPLITVIYKPDSTLMGRENLPSIFSPLFILLHLSPAHSFLSSSFPFIHVDAVSVGSNTFATSSCSALN